MMYPLWWMFFAAPLTTPMAISSNPTLGEEWYKVAHYSRLVRCWILGMSLFDILSRHSGIFFACWAGGLIETAIGCRPEVFGSMLVKIPTLRYESNDC